MTTGTTSTDKSDLSAPEEIVAPGTVLPEAERNSSTADVSSGQEFARGITTDQVTDEDAKPDLIVADESSDDDGEDSSDSSSTEEQRNSNAIKASYRGPVGLSSSRGMESFASFAMDELSEESGDDDDGGGEVSKPQSQEPPAATPEPASGATALESAENKQSIGPYTRREYTFAICAGSVMAFNSGYVNGSCLTGFIAPSGRKQATASLTGTTSRAGLALGDGNFEDFAFLIGMVLSFMCGACISGLLTPFPTPFRMEPTYGPTFLLGAAFLVLSSILAAFEIQEDCVFFLAAAANGIQNGISSIYSKNLIRSTGYTGAITDISIVLAQISQGNRENAWKLGVLVTLLASFWIGGTISYFSAKRFTSFSLLINAGIFVMIGGSLVAFLMIEFGVTLRQAVTGTWKWQTAMQSLHEAFLDTSVFVPRRFPGMVAAANDDEDDDNVGTLTRIGGSGAKKQSLGRLSDRHLNQIFTRLDKDNSNSLDQSELFEALQKAGMDVSRKDCDVMMRHADNNGDGVLSREEWIEIARACEKKPKKATLLASSWHATTRK